MPLRQRTLTQRVMDQVVGEISRLQLDLDPVALPCEGSRHDNVILDPVRSEPEYSAGPFEFRVKVRVDDLFLAREPCKRLLLAETFDFLLAGDGPIGLSGPASRRRAPWGRSAATPTL